MSIGVVATLRVQEGKTAEFEAVFTELVRQVLANEPGVRTYHLTRSRADATVYKVLEVYEDQAALEAHGKTDYFKAAGRQMRDLLGGAPDIEYLDGVG